METTDSIDAIERRVMQNIRFHARGLARHNTVPGMNVHDYEQDLTADLVRRRPAFDSNVASFATFADRIIRHRVSTLKTATLRSRAERNMASLDAAIVDVAGDEHTLLDGLTDPASLTEEDVALGIDMHRFLAGLGGPEWLACEILLADSISDGARAASINRSTAYARIGRLRELASAEGLADYVADASDTSFAAAVSGSCACVVSPATAGTENREATPMNNGWKPASPHLFVTAAELSRWINEAASGETAEYFRGLLSFDRDPDGSRLRAEDQRELSRVADRARSAADRGFVHLLQRRYGTNDYGYLIVARARASCSEEGA